ncbi:hypothetical protein DPEC_G00044470 [Dallia pectoralis]|uniref:Uncharacterized protein n=1 Tax=Dallia pectoralis TaxID=75939 RepID=A0ACC2H9N9_DALPE|nr:hypothetical protein DPEC_G00044470 [Dallia pectoralis]
MREVSALLYVLLKYITPVEISARNQLILSEKFCFGEMETRRLRRDIRGLLGDYIGLKLRENGFDPQGKEPTTMLDDLAHYDLAISVALWWLEQEEGCNLMDTDIIGDGNPGRKARYPSHLEREAMILSSFAGMILNSLPVEDILALYSTKPSTAYSQHSKSAIVHPFSLSYHPFAMLSSFKVVDHSRKHSQKLKRWLSVQAKAGAAPAGRKASVRSSSKSNSFLSDSGTSSKEQTEQYEESKESLQDK